MKCCYNINTCNWCYYQVLLLIIVSHIFLPTNLPIKRDSFSSLTQVFLAVINLVSNTFYPWLMLGGTPPFFHPPMRCWFNTTHHQLRKLQCRWHWALPWRCPVIRGMVSLVAIGENDRLTPVFLIEVNLTTDLWARSNYTFDFLWRRKTSKLTPGNCSELYSRSQLIMSAWCVWP